LPRKREKRQQWSGTEKVCKQVMLIAELWTAYCSSYQVTSRLRIQFKKGGVISFI